MSYITSNDPVDHQRTSRPLVGQALKSPAKEPALLLMAVGLAAYGICLAGFAYGQYQAGVVAAAISLLAMAMGGAWLWKEARRVRKLESDWNIKEHKRLAG
ncbi:LapA family protein [Mycobacterium sp. 94-17]|uniref:LapA family protein n=1 Tax=Mycobacterium sp. 94-17 TaxID=2986147 RepID=UPI002D1E7C44|nr:LapA family protein [Mycobacterium sp. 94-17]MEB4207725.1 LapA family protein [Mycobacterium sp. 94-17]